MFKIIVLTILAINIIYSLLMFNSKIKSKLLDKLKTINLEEEYTKSAKTQLVAKVIWFLAFLIFM